LPARARITFGHLSHPVVCWYSAIQRCRPNYHPCRSCDAWFRAPGSPNALRFSL